MLWPLPVADTSGPDHSHTISQSKDGSMNTGLVWAAAAVSLATFFGHVFAGGPRVAKPLLASGELPEQAKWMGYFCWHVTSILVLAMSVGFALTALHPDLSGEAGSPSLPWGT